MRRRVDIVLNLATALVLCLLIGMSLTPRGVFGEPMRKWYARRQLVGLVKRHWPALVATGARIDDASAAPVEVVEFADFQCPACKATHDALARALPGDMGIHLIYRHYPLAIHPAAEGAARAAICAEAQERFVAMYHRLFSTADWQLDQDWTREARAAGVPDVAMFERCLTSGATRNRLNADLQLARLLAVAGTPTFFTARDSWAGASTPAQISARVAPR